MISPKKKLNRRALAGILLGKKNLIAEILREFTLEKNLRAEFKLLKNYFSVKSRVKKSISPKNR